MLTLTCFEFEIFGDVQFSVFLSVRYQEDQLEAGFREFYVHFGSHLTRSHWEVSLEHSTPSTMFHSFARPSRRQM